MPDNPYQQRYEKFLTFSKFLKYFFQLPILKNCLLIFVKVFLILYVCGKLITYE